MKIQTEDGEMLPPYILQFLEMYEYGVSNGNPKLIDHGTRFNIMQAFYAGFSQACKLVDAVHAPDFDPAARKEILGLLKDELKRFGQGNREVAAKMGVRTVRL